MNVEFFNGAKKVKQKSGNLKHSLKDKVNFNTIIAAFFILFFSMFYFLIPYQIAKPKLFLGRALMGLKPTLFPRLITVALICLSILYLIGSFELKEKHDFRDIKILGYFRVLVTIIVTIAYALLLEPLGFVISSVISVGFLSFFFGNRNFLMLILVTIGLPLAIYFLFTRLMLVSLPANPFF